MSQLITNQTASVNLKSGPPSEAVNFWLMSIFGSFALCRIVWWEEPARRESACKRVTFFYESITSEAIFSFAIAKWQSSVIGLPGKVPEIFTRTTISCSYSSVLSGLN